MSITGLALTLLAATGGGVFLLVRGLRRTRQTHYPPITHQRKEQS